MKKILEGFFYRMLRSVEFWGLIILLVCSCVYINVNLFANEPSIHGPVFIVEDWETGTGWDASGDELKEYQFENSGVSAYDAYRYGCEPITQESFDKLSDDNSLTDEEIFFLVKGISSLNLIPAILIVLFIPFFFGRMFSDGTLKNLISCGHSKGKIYLASLVFVFALDLVMFLFNFVLFLIMIPANGWKPPVYFPVVFLMFVISLLLLFAVSSISLAVLYASSRMTASFVAGFIIAIMMFFPIFMLSLENVDMSYQLEGNTEAAYDEYIAVVKEKGPNSLTYKFDASMGAMRVFCGEKELMKLGRSNMPNWARTTLLTIVYLDPTMCTHMMKQSMINPYMAYRDGVMAINIAANVFWILISTAVGAFVFKKREIYC